MSSTSDCAGVSNEFLINTGAETALMYNDNSVNENMHTAKAFQILLVPQNNFVSHLPEQHFKFFRRTLISIILSTDMAGHTDLIRVHLHLLDDDDYLM